MKKASDSSPISALVSILTLQNTLIMVNSKDGGQDMLPLTAGTSALVWVAVRRKGTVRSSQK